MKKDIYRNHINISFNIIGKGDSLVESINTIYEISKRHNGQNNLFENRSSWKYDNKGDIIGEAVGNIGGTITFHSHSCNIEAASNELTATLLSLGVKETETYMYDETKKELVKV